jgi:hypothetical protein
LEILLQFDGATYARTTERNKRTIIPEILPATEESLDLLH